MFTDHSIGTYIIRAALDWNIHHSSRARLEHTSFEPRSIWTYIIRAALDWNVHYSSRAKRKICFPELHGQQKARSYFANAQSDQGPRCLLPESLDTIKCINGEQRPTSDCTCAGWCESEPFAVCLKALFRLTRPNFDKCIDATCTSRSLYSNGNICCQEILLDCHNLMACSPP